MTILVTFNLSFKNEAVADAKAWMASEDGLSATRGTQGCLEAHCHEDQNNPNEFLFYERWETKADYDAYMQWRIERGDFENMVTMLTSEPAPRIWNHIA